MHENKRDGRAVVKLSEFVNRGIAGPTGSHECGEIRVQMYSLRFGNLYIEVSN
jgi:hypothetical protein